MDVKKDIFLILSSTTAPLPFVIWPCLRYEEGASRISPMRSLQTDGNFLFSWAFPLKFLTGSTDYYI